MPSLLHVDQSLLHPNIGYEVKEGGWRTVVAKKNIRKGDELVASYIGDTTNGARKERQEALGARFKYDCEYKRCGKERKAEPSAPWMGRGPVELPLR